jgi:hypothetical protein
MDWSEAARVLGGLPKRKQYERTCPICSKSFVTTAAGVYCSASCRAKAQTRRKTAARRARWTEQATPSS